MFQVKTKAISLNEVTEIKVEIQNAIKKICKKHESKQILKPVMFIEISLFFNEIEP